MFRNQRIFHILSRKLVFICLLIALGPWLSYAFLLKFNPDTDFGIIGPERVCLITGNTLETFTTGGNPLTDVYRWEITEPDGNVRTTPAGSGFWGNPDLNFTFSKPGDHVIRLIIRRPGFPEFREEKIVPVIQGPTIVLDGSYSVCDGQDILLRALDPATPNLADYVFEWTDEDGDPVGTATNEITVGPGTYSVTYYFINSDGDQECQNTLETTVEESADFDLEISSSTVCPGGQLVVEPSVSFTGAWFYQKDGGAEVFIRNGRSVTLLTSDLDGIGEYAVIFRVSNPTNPDCEPVKTIPFTYNPNPDVKIEFELAASNCTTSDGSLEIEAFTDIDLIRYVIDADKEKYGPGFSMVAGDIVTLPNLASGVYVFEIFRGGCFLSSSTFVPLAEIPPGLDFSVDPDSIVPETCSNEGKNPGGFIVSFPVPPQGLRYELYNQRGGIAKQGDFDDEVETDFYIEVVGGVYFLEVFEPNETEEGEEEEAPCKVPNQVQIEIPALEQVEFSVPQDFRFCGFYELTPTFDPNENYEFSLVDLDDPTEPERTTLPFIIDKPGNYAVIGRHLDFPEEICPRRIEIKAENVEAPIFEEKFESMDCEGNQVWKVNLDNYLSNQVNIRWFNESNQLVSTSETMRPVTDGLYRLEVQPRGILGACPDAFRVFEVPPSVLSVVVSLDSTPLCPSKPDATITLDSDFDNIGRIAWRYFDSEGNIEELTSVDKEIIGAKPGTYEVAVFSNLNPLCEIGRESIEIPFSTDLTDFNVPDDLLTVCESYEWTPSTAFELRFELIYPDGSMEEKEKGESFTLDQTGEYTLRGNPVGNSNEPFCPIEKTFEVKVVEPIPFEVKFVDRDCEGLFTYTADIGAADPAEADFFWRKVGTNAPISTTQIFQTKVPGNYTLEVQPKGSLPCDVESIPFEIVPPVLALDVALEADAFCPEAASTLIRIAAIDTELYTISWTYINPITNDRLPLIQHDGEIEIQVDQEGVYEVQVEDEFNCKLALDEVLVIRSADPIRPIVNETYQICREYKIGETINPGNFQSYKWILDQDTVSTSSSYKPQIVGDWVVSVTSMEGCVYEAAFEVQEECELRVSLPNGLILDDDKRNFLVFTNYLVDEIEVYIFNKWGQQVFQCVNKEASNLANACPWDGYFSGEKVLPGAYAVRVIYRNIGEDIQKNLNTTLTVF